MKVVNIPVNIAPPIVNNIPLIPPCGTILVPEKITERKECEVMKLYYHKTDGGAEYLTDTYYLWGDNKPKARAGCFNHKTKYIVRIDGDIERDAELTIRENK